MGGKAAGTKAQRKRQEETSTFVGGTQKRNKPVGEEKRKLRTQVRQLSGGKARGFRTKDGKLKEVLIKSGRKHLRSNWGGRPIREELGSEKGEDTTSRNQRGESCSVGGGN